MSTRKKKILKATPEELKLIEDMTRRGAFERLDAGESEIVDEDDWSDIPELPEEEEARFLQNTVTLPKTLYRRLRSASKKRNMSPDRLASKCISRMLAAPAKKL